MRALGFVCPKCGNEEAFWIGYTVHEGTVVHILKCCRCGKVWRSG